MATYLSTISLKRNIKLAILIAVAGLLFIAPSFASSQVVDQEMFGTVNSGYIFDGLTVAELDWGYDKNNVGVCRYFYFGDYPSTAVSLGGGCANYDTYLQGVDLDLEANDGDSGNGNYWVRYFTTDNPPGNGTTFYYVKFTRFAENDWTYSGSILYDTSTRIISVTPAEGASVASTTDRTMGFVAYVGESDVGKKIHYQVFPVNTVAGTGSIFGVFFGDTIDYPAYDVVSTSTGMLYFSTTTDLTGYVDGTYTSSVNFYDLCADVPLLGVRCLDNLRDSYGRQIASTTYWYIGQDSVLGTDFKHVEIALRDLYSGNSTTTPLVTYCNVLFGFDPLKCIGSLFAPNKAQLKSLLDQASDGFLSYIPFGYVKRFYNIVIGNEVSTLPSLSISIPSGYPGAGVELDMTPWGKLMGGGSYLATATSTVSGDTFYESFTSYWSTFVYFVFGSAIILELINLNGTMTLSWGGSKGPKKDLSDRGKNKRES